MTANQKAQTAILWLKQATITSFSTIIRKFNRVGSLQRNMKTSLIMVAIWLMLVVGGHFAFNSLAEHQTATTYQSISASVQQTAQESGSILLEAELPELNRKVKDITNQHEVLFATIVDHQNKIMAHSDPDQLNRAFEFTSPKTEIQTIDQVAIATTHLADGRAVTTFEGGITFSGVQIGTMIAAVSTPMIQQIPVRYKRYKQILWISSALILLAGLFLLNRPKIKSAKPVTTQVSPQESMEGSSMGPYQLREKIGQGGMAELYKADYIRRDGFRRKLAVKRVLPHLVKDQEFIDMFIREARLAALLQHPNIVQITDFGKIHDTYFIAMEYIESLNLGQIMAKLKTGLPIDLTTFIATKISLGLDYSHNRKDDQTGEPLEIVHRDISPQNILISYQGEVKISDFGISKANTEPSLTQVGVIKGKLRYLSPEQALGHPVDNQCDIYALGIVLYEILTANRVYKFDSDIEAIQNIPKVEITPLKQVRPEVSDGLNDIVMKCLEKDKSLRYANAGQIHDDLVRLKNRLHTTFDATDLSNFMRNTFREA